MVTEYEGNAADYRQLQQDGKDHARTSYESLSRYVRNMSATPTDRTKRSEIQKWMKDPKRRAPNKAQHWPCPSPSGRDQLEDMQLWLSLHADELPPELEDEKGRAKNHRSAKEIPEAAIRNATTHSEAAKWSQHSVGERTFSVDNQTWETDDGDVGSKYEQQGNYFVGEAVCYVSLADVVRDIIKTADSETAELLRALPTSPTARRVALKVRGRRYEKHAERQQAGLRWRGMEYMDACAKADAHMASGKKRTKVTSSAKPLPDVGILAQYLAVEDGQLVRLPTQGARAGVVKSKHVMVEGVRLNSTRVLYALTTGQDAGDKVVRNGEASTYRKSQGSVVLREDGKWDALMWLGSNKITIGEYASEEYATKALGIFMRSLEMGLRSYTPVVSVCGNR